MKKTVSFISAIIISLPIIFYIINFRNGKFSDNNDDWGKFGDYLSGFFSSLIALMGILVTYYLGVISDKRNVNNLNVEKLKHRPILFIGYWDAQNKMEIYIENKGKGPLIIKEYNLINLFSSKIENRVFDILPRLSKDRYQNYTGNLNELVLKPDEKFQLFLFENGQCREDRKLVRQSLKDYKLCIKYNDVYNEIMPLAERDLSWFGRNLNS